MKNKKEIVKLWKSKGYTVKGYIAKKEEKINNYGIEVKNDE